MPKHEFLTPKAIANRIKSKGLQKLRWYCQMCQKQCRDENGFKCHTMSESHQRQLLLVAENPGRFVGGFSAEFLKGFMDILRRQYGTRRIHCNVVYQEYIKDKDHYHMNATRWSTLTGFVMWLGRNGLCEVESTPKGWYITYIDRSPEALARQAADDKKKKMDRDDEERTQRMVDEQIVRALANNKKEEEENEEVKYVGLERTDENEKLTFKLFGTSKEIEEDEGQTSTDQNGKDVKIKTEMLPPKTAPRQNDLKHNKSTPSLMQTVPNVLKLAEEEAKSKGFRREERKRKVSAVEEVFKMEEERREKRNRKDYWLHEGIIVKVIHQKLGEKYYKRKGVIEEVQDLYTAVVRMLDTNDKLKIDQTHLETVIPMIGKELMVVNGAYRGCKAILESVDMKNYCVCVKISQGPSRGRLIDQLAYEDVSKLYIEDS